MANDTTDLLQREIYPRIFDRANTIFVELNFTKRGRDWQSPLKLDCSRPSTARKDKTVITSSKPFRILEQGGASVSFWDYIENRYSLTNSQEVLIKLAELAQYDLPKDKSFNPGKHEEQKQRNDILEASIIHFKGALSYVQAKPTLDYLKDHRGYTVRAIEAMELGYYSSQEGLKTVLCSLDYSVNEVNTVNNELFTYGFGDTHKLVIPVRDELGRIKGLCVRSLDKDEKNKYKYNKGLQLKEHFFNIYQANKTDPLVIVEGFLDALISTAHEIKGVVAIGSAIPSSEQVDQAINKGFNKFVLALDNDSDKEIVNTRIEKSIKMIEEQGGKVYIASLPDGIKDPDELIREKGAEAFQEAIDQAESGARWVAKRLLSKHSKHGKQCFTDQERDLIIYESIEYEETITDTIDSQDFIETLTDGLGISKDVLAPKIEEYHKKKDEERARIESISLYSKAQELAKEGKVKESKELIRKGLAKVKESNLMDYIQPYTEGQALTDLNRKGEGYSTGIATLDKEVIIPKEAITIIAGRPSHGKTTLMLNMFINMIKDNPEEKFFFLSYEQTKSELYIKMVTILAGKEGYRGSLNKVEKYIREGKTDIEEIEQAKEEYEDLVANERLWLIEYPFYIEDLREAVNQLKETHGETMGACFIDYIQKVKTSGSHQSRQLEIQKVSEGILELSKETGISIVLGAQLNREKEAKEVKGLTMAHLRESGDIEQDANLILGIHNESVEENSDKNIVTVNIKVLKNRSGRTGAVIPLSFNRPISIMEEEIK
jgi:replicative DNA helicase